MHIGGVILMEPQPGGGAPPIDQIRSDVIARLPDLPRYRERLSSPRTGGLHWPAWEDDTDFRVERHVRLAGLPAPAGNPELIEWAGEYYSQRLDRSKPLWEITIVELADGRWAIVTKTHHCMIDGVGSVDMAATLLDEREQGRVAQRLVNGFTPSALTEPEQSEGSTWRRAVSRVSRPCLAVGHAAVRAAQAGLHAAESAIGVATPPSRAREAWRRSKALAELLVRDELIAAPHCSLNQPIGARRELAVVSVELDNLREIRNGLGGTLNDVVLAAAAGGLRRLLLGRGEELPEAGLRAMVPVNLRTAGDRLAMGNRISSLFVHLPVAEPIEAPLRKQVAEAESLKAGTQATGSST
jgi:WS/DGAT/MGAT family acyltransferase